MELVGGPLLTYLVPKAPCPMCDGFPVWHSWNDDCWLTAEFVWHLVNTHLYLSLKDRPVKYIAFVLYRCWCGHTTSRSDEMQGHLLAQDDLLLHIGQGILTGDDT